MARAALPRPLLIAIGPVALAELTLNASTSVRNFDVMLGTRVQAASEASSTRS